MLALIFASRHSSCISPLSEFEHFLQINRFSNVEGIMHRCLTCGSNAFVLLTSLECTNYRCQHYKVIPTHVLDQEGPRGSDLATENLRPEATTPKFALTRHD